METWVKVLIVIAVLLGLYYYGEYKEEWKEENCDLILKTYTYSSSCHTPCDLKCSEEGFGGFGGGYFEDLYLEGEEYDDTIEKPCECYCYGCREE